MIKSAKQILKKPLSPNLSDVLGRGITVGILTGLVVSIFRLIINWAMQLLAYIYPQMHHHYWLLLPYILLMFLVSWLLGKIIKPFFKNLVGSGVAQIQASLLDENPMPWWDILWRKFIGGLLAFCPGLMLGREGPCMQMGAMIGQGLAQDAYHLDKKESHRLEQSGIAAGLSAAASAPLAGVFFLAEVITFKFRSTEILSALVASFSADLITVIFFGTKPVLHLPVAGNLPLNAYWSLPLLGIILGLLAYAYQWCLLSLKSVFNKLSFISPIHHSIIPLFLIIPLGFWNTKLLGGSHVLITSLFNHELISSVSKGSTALVLIAILVFVIRFFYTMLSYGSSVPGGIFMPILTLGALLGVIFANILIHNNIITSFYYPHIIIISMAAYLGAVLKAPITATILLTEMVGTIQQILPIIITTFIAYYILDLLGGRPIYAALRYQMNFKKTKEE